MELSEKIQKLINEELSISFEVEKIANILATYILNDTKQQQVLTIGKLHYKENEFIYNLFGIDFTVHYNVYTNVDPDSDRLYGCAYIEDKRLELHLCLANGAPYVKKFNDIIFHELLHAYQYSKNKIDYLSNKQTAKLY